MTWFDILKNSELVQSQRQGMKPIDIQKPFKRVKEEDDCFNKLIAFVESRFEFETRDPRKNGGFLAQYHKNYFVEPNENPLEYLFIGFNPEIPDEMYCLVLEALKVSISHSLKIDWTKGNLMSAPLSSMPSHRDLEIISQAIEELDRVNYIITYGKRKNLLLEYNVYEPEGLK